MMSDDEKDAIREIIRFIMSHPPAEIGLDQYHADVLRTILMRDQK
jgi:hypothetical protein